MQWDKSYWSKRYQEAQTQWDVGYITTPIREYFDQVSHKDAEILIPGSGNGYEAEYLFKNGFKNVFVLDLAPEPLKNLKSRVQEFPDDHLLQENFFDHSHHYDLVVEQTFFCSLEPSMRTSYVDKMLELLKPGGRLVGVLFDDPLNADHPPYGGNLSEYRELFGTKFHIHALERCYNSIKPRAGREVFINLRKSGINT